MIPMIGELPATSYQLRPATRLGAAMLQLNALLSSLHSDYAFVFTSVIQPGFLAWLLHANAEHEVIPI